MKQHGKTWITADNKETLAKYIPKHEILFEKIGQKIAGEATELETRLRSTKAHFVNLCKEVLRNNPDHGLQRRVTFHTFDREFRIEFDIKEEYVRVYRATKKNPSSKDYELIVLDLNRISIENGIVPPLGEPIDKDEAVDIGLFQKYAQGEQNEPQYKELMGIPLEQPQPVKPELIPEDDIWPDPSRDASN